MKEPLVNDVLREARRKASMTQRDLADRLGITASAVGQWETGKTTPSWKQAQALAEIFADEPVTQPDGGLGSQLQELDALVVLHERQNVGRYEELTAVLRELTERVQSLESSGRRASGS